MTNSKVYDKALSEQEVKKLYEDEKVLEKARELVKMYPRKGGTQLDEAMFNAQIALDFPQIATSYEALHARCKELRRDAKSWYDDGYSAGVSDGYNSTEEIVRLSDKVEELEAYKTDAEVMLSALNYASVLADRADEEENAQDCLALIKMSNDKALSKLSANYPTEE